MTVPDLIEIVLQKVREQFYGDKPARDFARDRTALVRAVARYGFACHRNGWEFEAHQIAADLVKLLPQIKAPDHQWLPRYLENCIDRSIRQRAEGLQAHARKNAAPAAVAARGLSKLTVAEVRQPGTVEILDALYRDQRSRAKAKKKTATPAPKPTELSLL